MQGRVLALQDSYANVSESLLVDLRLARRTLLTYQTKLREFSDPVDLEPIRLADLPDSD